MFSSVSAKLPLIVILGATGSGKTKLSLELVKKFGGEIIGADSMQVYKGLDIITAKATEKERRLAPHHLINILNPTETCTVIEYRNKAVQIIDDLLLKNKIPIIVGGTNYYIEALLWKILVEEPGIGLINKPGIAINEEHQLPSEELHKQLKLLDPNMAKRLHPNNKRKILRALEVLRQKGRKLSDILEEQQKSFSSSSEGGLRYPNTLILWLQCDQEKLNQRLNDRVDKMIQEGLVEELLTFHKDYNEARIKTNEMPDYTRGIFQSIGFKEFHQYLILDDSLKESDDGKLLLQEGIDKLKMVTRRYAKKQIKWINNRFLGRFYHEVPPVYGLDTTDVTLWDKKVKIPAIEIIESYLSNSDCNYQRLSVRNVESNSNANDETYNCEICNRVFVGKFQWKIHQKSNRHKKQLQKLHKEQKKSNKV